LLGHDNGDEDGQLGENRIIMTDEESSRADRAAKSTVARRSGRQGRRAPLEVEQNARVQAHIGNQLKIIYDTIVSEAVPDSLLDLLRKVDGAGNDKKPNEQDKRE